MPNWRALTESLDVTQILLTVLGGLGAAWLWMRARYKTFATWRATRAARHVAFAELPTRVAEFSAVLDTVRERQLMTLSVLDQHTSTLNSQNQVLSNISAMIYGEMELDPMPRFICDSSGKNLNVNTAYARFIGGGRDELLGFGYQRFMTHDLNPGFMLGFAEAAKGHRPFDAVVHVRRPDGTVIDAHVRVVPHPEHEPPATYWVGVVTHARRASDGPAK